MPEGNLDVNQTEAASSAASSSEGVSSQGDVNQDGAASSSAQQQAPKETQKTLDQVIQDAAKASLSSSEEENAESGVQKLNETKEEGKEESSSKQDDKEEQTEEGKEGEEKHEENVPYERFSEVNEKAKRFETELTQAKPLVDAQQSIIQHCQANNIAPEQFANWMEIAALVNSDPAKALEKLAPIVQGLQGFTGDVLPQDLQKAVDNGDISLDMAKRLVKAENQGKFVQQRSQQTQQQIVQQEQQRFVSEMQGAVSNWINTKKASDPDFQPKTKQDAPHGKFEFFMNEFAALAKANADKVRTSQDLIGLAEQAFANINASFKSMLPKPKPTKQVTSTQSSTSQKQQPKSVDDVITRAAKKHGIDFVPAK